MMVLEQKSLSVREGVCREIRGAGVLLRSCQNRER